MHTRTHIYLTHMYTTGATGTEDKHDGRKMKGVRTTPGRVGVHPSARMKGTGADSYRRIGALLVGCPLRIGKTDEI